MVPKTKPLMDGYTAREDGKPVEANPHKTEAGPRKLMRDAWDEGWYIADDHIKAEHSEAIARALKAARKR